ncbi:MAG: leucine-rich repeat domain-containing protein, partial [Bacteroidaceae bacterium]|nr:leucine-rich repeat domain-containing protein [Bacteroidaceae bacterium]
TIGDCAFEYCSGLTSITIPNSVTSIGSGAFAYCSGLTSIKVDAGNTKYDSRNDCNAIIETATNTLVAGCKNTTIPNSVTSIGDVAFSGCTGLTSITIPNSVNTIGDSAFWECSGLTSITIPNSVTSIGNSAFYDCSGLTSITIPNSVTSIGNYVFLGCTGLTSITIPNSVTSIGYAAFDGCTGLTSITIPNSVTAIGDWAFYYCTGLTSITIPNSVTSIGSHAFEECTGLTNVYALRDEPDQYNCNASAFSDNVPTATCILHVPMGSKAAYAATAPWSSFENIVEEDLTPVRQVTLSEQAGNAPAATCYDLQGRPIIGTPQHGIVIVRYSDGTSRKMYVR